MPKIDISALPVKTGSSYPGTLAALMEGRSQVGLSGPGGLTQFGANLVTLAPGALSSIRHWHEQQDEFLVVLSGALTLRDDAGDTALAPGDCCAFPAGDPNGHHIVNTGDQPGSFVVVGTHTETETGWYPDDDMKVTIDSSGYTFTKSDGSAL